MQKNAYDVLFSYFIPYYPPKRRFQGGRRGFYLSMDVMFLFWKEELWE